MEQNIKSKQIHWIDVAKGLGIIAVAMSHGMFPFHMMLDGFHMQLFFILAGYTFSVKSDFSTFMEKKAVRLLIPLWFWSLFLLVDINPGTLWFLHALVPSLVLFYFVVKYLPQYGIAILALVLSLLFWGENSLQGHMNPDIDRVLITQVFLSIGYLFKCLMHYIENRTSKCKISLLGGAFLNLFLFIVLFAIYMSLLLYGNSKGMFNGLSNGATMISYGNNTMFRLYYPYIAVLCLTGPFAIIFLSRFINSSKVLEITGRNSLVVMCTHVPILEFMNVHIAQMPHFEQITYKCLYAAGEYTILIVMSIAICYFCNRYMPTLTGGQKIIKNI